MTASKLIDSALLCAGQFKPRSLIVSVFLAIVLYKYRSHAVGTRPRRDLKQPWGAVPLLGHMPLMASIPGNKLYSFFEKQYNDLGPVWSISLPFMGRMIQGDTPEMIEHVLKTNFWNYVKGDILRDTLGDIMGRTFFVLEGEEWKFQRKIAMQVLNVNAFRKYTSDVFVQEGKKVIGHLRKAADEGTVIDFQALMLHYTLDSFASISLGESFGCLDNIEKDAPLAVAFDRLLSVCADRLVDPAWRIREYLTGISRTVKSDLALIKKHYRAVLDKRRREGYDDTKHDLLQLVMEETDEDGNPLPDELVVDILYQMTVAARDTTAQGLSWTLYSMLHDGADENIMKNLLQEVDDVLEGSEPVYETHKRQKWAEACFNETQRIFPSGPRNLRLCAEDDVLPGGVKIYKGEWFTWSPYVMGRSELLWGPDAKEYKPSRWIGTERPSASKFIAFNTGPRTCPGQQFATIESLTIMAMIFQSFELELVHPDKLPAHGISLTFPMVEGLPVRVKHRSANKSA